MGGNGGPPKWAMDTRRNENEKTKRDRKPIERTKKGERSGVIGSPVVALPVPGRSGGVDVRFRGPNVGVVGA